MDNNKNDEEDLELPFEVKCYASKTLEEFEGYLRHEIPCTCDDPKPCIHFPEFRRVKLFADDLQKRKKLQAHFESAECYAHRMEALRPKKLVSSTLEFLEIKELLTMAAFFPVNSDTSADNHSHIFSELPVKKAREEIGRRIATIADSAFYNLPFNFQGSDKQREVAVNIAMKPLRDLLGTIEDATLHRTTGKESRGTVETKKAMLVLTITRDLIEKTERLPTPSEVHAMTNSLGLGYVYDSLQRQLRNLGFVIPKKDQVAI